MSVLRPQPMARPQPAAQSVLLWVARYGTGARQWFTRHLSAGRVSAPHFDIWAGFPAGASLYNEASGLDWESALALAARCRDERPGARVLVLDAAGATVG